MKRGIRLLSSLMTTLLVATAIPFVPVAKSNVQAATIVVTRSNFTAEGTYKEFMRRYDSSGDGNVDTDELAAMPTLNMPGWGGFGDCSWVKYCTNCTSIILSNDNVTAIDLTGLTKLTKLTLGGNSLTSLNLSTNSALTELDVSSNTNLASLTLPKTSSLTKITANNGKLTSIDLSSQTSVTNLNLAFNSLTSIDISKCTALKDFDCRSNKLTSLNIKNNTSLSSMYCFNNSGLTSINVYGNRYFEYLMTLNYKTNQTDSVSGATYWGASSGGYRIYIPVNCTLYSSATDTNPNPTVTTTPTAIPMSSVASTTIYDQDYTGSAITLKPTLTYGGKTLVEGTDYTITFKNNTNPGQATVTVKGINKYDGTKVLNYNIYGDLSKATISAIGDQTYTGSAIKPSFTVTCYGKTLTEGTDYKVTYSNNTNVGTATVKISQSGYYSGSKSTTFSIVSGTTALTDSNVTLSTTSYTYTGSAITPVPTVKVGTKTLVKDTDYTVSYSGNTAAGTGTVTVTGKGSYTGTIKKTFTISKATIASSNVTLSTTSYTYTGSAITPVPTVKVGTKTLVKDTDYTVSYSGNTAAGTGTVTVTGKNNYTGTVNKTFTISKATIASSNVTLSTTSYTYTGSAITPVPTVKVGTKTLVKDTDYTVSYSNNTAAGTGTVTVTGKNNYTGTVNKTFTITSGTTPTTTTAPTPTTTALTDSNVTLSATSYTYTGSAITPVPTVKVGTKTLVKGTDYTVSYSNNTAAGTGTVTVKGAGNYTGTINKTFTISKATIASSNVTLSATSYTYTGSAITPVPTVKVGTKTLVKDTDYTVSYSGNTAAGTGTVTVTGKGNYTGTVNKTFTISKATITSSNVTLSTTSYTYTGSAITPVPTVKVGTKTLVKDTDYTVSYSGNTAAGTGTVTVTGKGNYTGTVNKTFTINKATIASSNVTLSTTSYTYTGSAITPVPTVKVGTKTLVKGTDYTVSYSGNTATGTATVTVKGAGNYTGTVDKTFTIVASTVALTSSNVTLSATSFTYTSGVIAPVPTVKVGTKTLVKDTDYTVSYSNNRNAGTATVTITGKGSYTGTVNVNFTILPRTITYSVISGVSYQKYTGNYITPSITVYDGDNVLSAGTDYDVVYSNNRNVGTATITVNGKGNYKNSISTTFEIKNDIALTQMTDSNLVITGFENPSYTGSAIKPDFDVFVNNKMLDKSDYIVAYRNNTKVGTATIAISGRGNYTGTVEKTFTIVPMDVNKLSVSSISDKSYTGSAINPSVVVKRGITNLVLGTDYTVSYSNNTNVGTATITITGIGNYTGTRTISFAIKPVSLNRFSVAAIPDKTYTGSAIKPATNITYGSKTLVAGTDYVVNYSNNTKVGTATVTITGKGNYTGVKQLTFNIVPVNVSKLSITSISDKTYTGKAIKPATTIMYGAKKLVPGTDYTVSYSNNTKVGTATITITGKGNYTGTRKITFKINPLNVTRLTVDTIYDKTYTGSAIKPVPVVKRGSVKLVKDTDYTVSYSNNTKVGTATITIKGKGNYTGTKKVTFRITPMSVSYLTVGSVSNKTYTGSPIKPVPVVKRGSVKLVAGTDFTLSYSNNIKAGTATITIRGKGNYTGTRKVTFKIVKAAAPTTPTTQLTGVEGFCERLYTSALNRSSDPTGIATWTRLLKSGEYDGAQVAEGFFFSQEFINSNVSNEEYVNRLYRTFMDREPDKAGYDFWVNYLNQGHTREEVFRGFVDSTEWATICYKFGIKSGGTGTPII